MGLLPVHRRRSSPVGGPANCMAGLRGQVVDRVFKSVRAKGERGEGEEVVVGGEGGYHLGV